MILFEGFSESVISICLPLPALEQPWISSSEHPLPIPIQWTRQNLVLLATIAITPSVFETPPSVRMKT